MKADPHDPMCRMPGCPNRWAVDCLHGKVCSEHDKALTLGHVKAPPTRHTTQPLPFREAARPFFEPVERDDEEPKF